MDKTYFKSKYVLIFILSLFIFISGLNYKHWCVTNNLTPKRISLIYSVSANDIGNKNLEKLLSREFRQQGIEPIFDRFYLDCNKLNEKEEIEHVRKYLELLENKSTDLILTIGDQSVYALLSTHHRLLSSVPVVACNVRFPNEKLIEEYDSRKVYVLRDSPDLKRNIDFIKTLYPHNDMEIIYNIDLTFLGHKSFDKLSRVVDRKSVRVLGYQKAFVQECDYKHLTEMIEYFNLTPGLVNDSLKKSGLTVSLCPFRYIRGAALLVMLEQSKRARKNQAFLLDKLDMMAIPIVTALNIPSFSCVREGFGENAKVVGGYMATEDISAKAAASLAVRLLKKEKIGMPKIRDLEKEYVLDWTYFTEYAGDISNVPKDVRIINYPFYDRYRKELYILGGLFVLSFILVTISLLRTHRRSLIERRNLQILEEVHKRLTLSMDGGKISLWNIQDGVLEFDDNFAQLVGLEQRRFTREDIMKYTHSEDKQLLNSFYETPHQAIGMQIQRIRFCFEKEGADYEWYEIRCSSLKDAKGEIMLAGIMQNIQKVVEHEQQLILAKQIAENAELKQSFLNNMSHEIRTPLNAIVGFTNLLVGEGADEIEPEEKAAMLEIVNNNNELLLKLVNDVLEISRLDSGNLSFDIKEHNITRIVREIYMTYQSMIQPSLQFVLELDEAIDLPVHIDCYRFTQVISNFLNNANKFTRAGTITLGCEIYKEHKEVRIYVKDTGKGIDDKELMLIFDRFYKTDEFEQGSGLGLSICKVIIERLAGRIEVHSEVGKGSCFSVILSLADTI
ncbi:sensor histidine kinase [Bacteroides faecium]|uniref:histidine kinase n=1 Tax=Bacteroides faecium TaxID=2715212 RepID=A0A6H0KU19_9BACE|nr:HAMP domain-containing sensor histidine kinase [Bacteroides faecium]QIU96653.1 HAMP domain-containing histidine kinase [Bacteroides faecium]